MTDITYTYTENINFSQKRVISQKWDFALFYIYVFLAFLHIPLFWFGDDSVGLYDLYQIFYLAVLLLRSGKDKYIFPYRWQGYFIVVGLYFSYLLLSYLIVHNPYNTTLMIKHTQYFMGLFIVISFFYRYKDNVEQIISAVQLLFLFMVIFQLLNFNMVFDKIGLHGILGYGRKYRLGLPLKLGTSSNPAGFVLGVFLIFSWEIILRQYKKTLITIITFILSLAALFLTVSRTNIIAFFATIALSLIIRLFAEKKYIIYFIFIVITILIMFILLVNYLPRSNKIWSMLQYVENPYALFSDSAFRARYTSMWVGAIDNWLENISTIFLGKGVGYQQWVDSTAFRLLGNQGLIGFLFFFYIWIYYFLRHFYNNRALILLLVFVLINSINGETLIVSFRTVQIYVVLLGAFLFAYKRVDIVENNK